MVFLECCVAWGNALPEYDVKAAFLYNLAKFTDWPPKKFIDVASPLSICVLGKDPFGKKLDLLVEKKKIQGHPLVAKRISALTDMQHCHVIFVSVSETIRLQEIFNALKDSSILSIGETPDFNRLGGMIRFFIDEQHIRFEINRTALEHVGLRIDARVLKIAENSPPGGLN